MWKSFQFKSDFFHPKFSRDETGQGHLFDRNNSFALGSSNQIVTNKFVLKIVKSIP